VLAAVVKIHSESPQKRLAKQVSDVLHKGGVIAYPTDSSYALGCHLGDKSALKKIAQIRKIDQKHHFTLIGRVRSIVSSRHTRQGHIPLSCPQSVKCLVGQCIRKGSR